MPPLGLSAIARQLAQAGAGAGSGDLPDPELLRFFLNDRDEAAFAALVRRHGPMVLGVCRCVLRNRADAEDAFQAVFLVLARRAGSIRKGGSLASWLHGTAYRTARKALAASLRRRSAEAESPPRPPPEPDDLSWAEVQAIIHEELLALPERLRAALVLCYLEGATQERAAEALGATPAAVKKRLERGREQLRARLVRRGLGPAAILAALAAPMAASAVPPALAEAAGNLSAGAVPESIQSLVNAGVTPMVLSSWKVGFCVLLAAGVALAGAALQPRSQAQDPAPPAAARAADKKPAEKEAAWLEGEWKLVSVEAAGKSFFADDDLSDARVIFKDGKAEVRGFEVLFVRDFSFTLDPTQRPKEIDAKLLAGDRKGDTFEGIYVITVRNELRICLRLEQTKLGRPKGFSTVSGAGLYTFFLRPVKEKGPPPAQPAPAKPEKVPAGRPTDHFSARLVVRESKTEPWVFSPVLEVENASFAEEQVLFSPAKLKLELTDANGKPVPEARRDREGPDPVAVRGVIPAEGYVGFRTYQGGVSRPKGAAIFATTSQHWLLKPGKYTVKGSVALGLRPQPDLPYSVVRESVAARPLKLELKPVTFEIPAK